MGMSNGSKISKIHHEPTERNFSRFSTKYHQTYHDVNTKRVKKAFHVRFDKGMIDLPFDSIPPNIIHLQRTQEGVGD
jgi:hypothetical protein